MVAEKIRADTTWLRWLSLRDVAPDTVRTTANVMRLGHGGIRCVAVARKEMEVDL